jgi:membrane protein DedA with SNARE-associated domain
MVCLPNPKRKGVHFVQHYIAHLLQTYGYTGLFIALALEYVLAVPAETILTTTGILWQNKIYHLHIVPLILATSLGTTFGATLAYWVGRTLGRPFLIRYGKFVHLTPERINKADRLFAKYTLPTLVISRYIAVVRILIPYLAGINKVKFPLFVTTIFLSSILWTTTFITAGGVIEHAFGAVMHHWKRNLIPAAIILALLIVLYAYLHKWLARKMEAADKEAESESKETNN